MIEIVHPFYIRIEEYEINVPVTKFTSRINLCALMEDFIKQKLTFALLSTKYGTNSTNYQLWRKAFDDESAYKKAYWYIPKANEVISPNAPPKDRFDLVFYRGVLVKSVESQKDFLLKHNYVEAEFLEKWKSKEI